MSQANALTFGNNIHTLYPACVPRATEKPTEEESKLDRTRMPLLAKLLLVAVGAIMLAGSGTVAAQDDTPPSELLPPSGLKAEKLKNGIWLEWTRSTEPKYSHQRVMFCPRRDNGQCTPTFLQDEKARASYAFVPYTHLESGDRYDFKIETMRNQKTVIGSSNTLTVDIPSVENRPSLPPLPPDRPTTHPGGLQAIRSGGTTDYRFNWTPGIDPNYTDHVLRCRKIGLKPLHLHWTILHIDTEASTEVDRKGVIISALQSDNPTRHACRVFARTGTKWSPMTNRVTVKI